MGTGKSENRNKRKASYFSEITAQMLNNWHDKIDLSSVRLAAIGEAVFRMVFKDYLRGVKQGTLGNTKTCSWT